MLLLALCALLTGLFLALPTGTSVAPVDRALLGGRAQAELLKIEALATEAWGRIKGVLE